jgi:hypothetical protein
LQPLDPIRLVNLGIVIQKHDVGVSIGAGNGVVVTPRKAQIALVGKNYDGALSLQILNGAIRTPIVDHHEAVTCICCVCAQGVEAPFGVINPVPRKNYDRN